MHAFLRLYSAMSLLSAAPAIFTRVYFPETRKKYFKHFLHFHFFFVYTALCKLEPAVQWPASFLETKRYLMYEKRKNNMAAAGSDSQLLPLGKLWFSKDLCFKHCEVVKKITIFIRLLTLKQKMGKRSHVVLKSCCLIIHVQKYPLTVRLILKERFDSPMHSPTQNYKQCLVAAR